MLSFFTDDAVVRYVPPPLPPGREIYTGKHEIRDWAEALVADDTHVEVSDYQVLENTVTARQHSSADRYRQLGVDSVEATCELALQGDKIKTFSIITSPESASRLRAAAAALQC